VLSRALIAKLRSASDATIPADVMECAKLHFTDAVGVGLAASASQIGAPYKGLIDANHGGASSAFNASVGLAPADAALINGGLIHSLEFDDTHTGSIVHGSSVIAAAALAVAESAGSTGRELLGAFVRGWEVLVRLGIAAAGKYQQNGYQITPVGGTIAAAMVAADLMKLDEDRTVAAIGISLSQASGVFEFLSNGSSVKSLHPGWAAHAGITAARLAASGMTGPETTFEGRFGLFRIFARDEGAAERFAGLIESIGAQWYLKDAAFKMFPCCHYIHPFLECIDRLSAAGVTRDQIEKVVCGAPQGAAPIVCEPWDTKLNPGTPHAARWSLPVVMAEYWVEGRVTLQTFERPASASVRDLAARMAWEPLQAAQFPEKFGAAVTCHLRGGKIETVRVDDVYANASRPAKPGEVLAKFRSNAASAFEDNAREGLAAALANLGDAPDLNALTGALRSARRNGPSATH
jgi:2-methylcitrate dehydratase PrpD